VSDWFIKLELFGWPAAGVSARLSAKQLSDASAQEALSFSYIQFYSQS
jgi:hypothetical protein